MLSKAAAREIGGPAITPLSAGDIQPGLRRIAQLKCHNRRAGTDLLLSLFFCKNCPGDQLVFPGRC